MRPRRDLLVLRATLDLRRAALASSSRDLGREMGARARLKSGTSACSGWSEVADGSIRRGTLMSGRFSFVNARNRRLRTRERSRGSSSMTTILATPAAVTAAVHLQPAAADLLRTDIDRRRVAKRLERAGLVGLARRSFSLIPHPNVLHVGSSTRPPRRRRVEDVAEASAMAGWRARGCCARAGRAPRRRNSSGGRRGRVWHLDEKQAPTLPTCCPGRLATASGRIQYLRIGPRRARGRSAPRGRLSWVSRTPRGRSRRRRRSMGYVDFTAGRRPLSGGRRLQSEKLERRG